MDVLLNNLTDVIVTTSSIAEPAPGPEAEPGPDFLPTQLLVVVVMLSVFSVVGIIGNAIAIYIFARRRDKNTSVIFILALAGTDFFTCLVIIPFTITFEMVQYRVVYDVACKLFLFLQTSNIPFSAFIMVAIAFDRYFCICHPFLHAFTVPRAKLIVFLLALLALAFGVLTSLSFGMYVWYSANVTEVTSNNVSGGPDIVSFHTESQTEYKYRFADATVTPLGSNTNNNSAVVTHRIEGVRYYGQCTNNEFIVSKRFLHVHQKVYTAFFLVSFISVVVLYTLIYRSILVRRAKKAKRKKMNYYQSVAGAEPQTTAADLQTTGNQTQMTVLNGNTTHSELKPDETTMANTNANATKGDNHNKASTRRVGAGRETNLYANIKTAMMLFVVTLVFIVSFLPSWLTAHEILPFNYIVFYMYFVYNVANPVIYAFMNQTFREDLKKLVKVCK
ncbi:growth hormone secretagogue receptor type 1-like [Gigantopelta aegis]|uniref:growth hormone secretagogue receptor type 1-like n=1 Tax=Gigantopelta aegis TaxID=1735272 RepID=UPI001B88CF14|nr:growth hormone secretagogue receptor type 1-like [Gigantopelta aegis]